MKKKKKKFSKKILDKIEFVTNCSHVQKIVVDAMFNGCEYACVYSTELVLK